MSGPLFPKILFWIFIGVWIWAAIKPLYRFDWFLENIVIFLFAPFAILSYYKLRLSNYSYTLIFVFAILHILASHYTYQATPWGNWLNQIFGVGRNDFDRVVHFLYGFLMVQIWDEIFRPYINRGIFKSLFLFAVVFSVGSLYEVMEFMVGITVEPGKGLGFLGFQGDIWDTQKDMSLQALGAVLGLVIAALRIRNGK